MTAASSFRPGKRRPRPGSAGLRGTALAPLALAAFGFVVLLGPAPAAGQTVVINEDDFDDVVEGDAGTNTPYPIRVWLRESGVLTPATATSTVDFEIRPSTGFRLGRTMTGPATGTLTFLPGESEQTVNYVLVGDDDFESNEVFTFAVLRATGSASFSGVNVEESKTGRIINDDVPQLSITGTSTPEGPAGSTTTLAFTVTLGLNGVHHAPGAEFKYRVTGDSTAAAGDDYVMVPGGTLTKPRGAWTLDSSPTEFSWTIDVEVNGDDTPEGNETVEIEIYDATVEIADPDNLPSGSDNSYPVLTRTVPNVIGTGTIVNDDPALRIEAPSEADVPEGATGATTTLTFTVTLQPSAAVQVTVDWDVLASSTARVSSASSGMLTFQPGEASMTITVDFVGDDESEGDETLTVVLSNAQGADILPSATRATVTIIDDDGNAEARTRVLTYILAGIGRTIATNVVDLVWERAESHRTGGGTHATLGGRRLDTAFAGDGAEDGVLLRAAVGLLGVDADSEALLRDAERRLATGKGLDAFRDWVDLPDSRDLAGRTSFAVSFANGAEGLAPFTFWGRGNLTAFESGIEDGTFGDFTAEGDVVAGHLGLDYRFREDLLAGVALSHTLGDVDYAFADESSGRGAVETEITALHPYVHWMSSQGIGVWGTLGWGSGSAELAEEGQAAIETDLALQMAAFGVRDELARVMETDLALKADVFMTRVSADAVDGGKELQELDADASRGRLAVEGTRERSLDGGALLVGRFELGARVDGGDAEEGAGADLAGGFTWTAPDIGLEVRGRGSLLLVHQESDFREWGLGLGASWDPGVAGRGFSFSVEPTWRAPVSNGARAMWNASPADAGRPASARGASLDARLGYGMGILGDRALVTAFGELGRVDGEGRLRLGAELRRPAGGSPLGLELYGERRDRTAGPDHSLVLKGRLGF